MRSQRVRLVLVLIAGVVAVVGGTAWVVAAVRGPEESVGANSSGEAFRHFEVEFHENAPVNGRAILELGGLTVRADCIDYGRGRKYLSVVARTKINNTAAATVLSQGKVERATFAFRKPDFDRRDGWYDFLGTNPDGTSGTLSYSRPDGGQLSLIFRSDQATPEGDCGFEGTASYRPHAPPA